MDKFFSGMAIGCMLALGLHYFVPCDQAKLGHPKIVLSQGKQSG